MARQTRKEVTMKVICNKAGECKDVHCKEHEEHEEDFLCAEECVLISGAKCIPVEQYKPQVKPRRVRAFKEDVVKQNTLLEMRVHQLECELKAFKEMPTMRRIRWAFTGGAK